MPALGRRRSAAAVLAVALSAAACGGQRAAAPAPRTGPVWEAVGGEGGFMVGDSTTEQCAFLPGDPRSLGRVGWPGAATTDGPYDPAVVEPLPMWTRLHDTSGRRYPFTTVTGPASEADRWRDSGWKVVALGTIDAKHLTVEQYRANVLRFVDDAGGRPVLWLNTHSPAFEDVVRQLNAVLDEVAATHANVRVLDWDGFARSTATLPADPAQDRGGPTVPLLEADGVHVATSEGCEARMALIRAAAPAAPGQARAVGEWYAGQPAGQVSGWAADQTTGGGAEVEVRVDGRRHGRVLATGRPADPYAAAAHGSPWTVAVPAGAHRVEVVLVAADGQRTGLGTRTSR